MHVLTRSIRLHIPAHNSDIILHRSDDEDLDNCDTEDEYIPNDLFLPRKRKQPPISDKSRKEPALVESSKQPSPLTMADLCALLPAHMKASKDAVDFMATAQYVPTEDEIISEVPEDRTLLQAVSFFVESVIELRKATGNNSKL